MATYAISDIHGCYSMFLEMLDKIDFNFDKDTLYIIGDIMDRGPQVAEMIRWVWEHESEHIIMLRGNHEQMFLEYPDPQYYSYYFKEFSKEEIKHLLNWIANLPLYLEVTVNDIDYVLAHAGITKEILESGKDPKQYCLWARNEFYLGNGIPGKTIIFGHTPMMSRILDDEICVHIWKPKDTSIKMFGIDTGAVFAKKFGGKLSCLRLDDQKEFSVYA